MKHRLDQVVTVGATGIVVAGIAVGAVLGYQATTSHKAAPARFVRTVAPADAVPSASTTTVVPSYLPTGFVVIGHDSLQGGYPATIYGVPGQTSTPTSIPASVTITTIAGAFSAPPQGVGPDVTPTTVRGHSGYLVVDQPSGSFLLTWPETDSLTIQLAVSELSQDEAMRIANGLVVSS